MKDFQAAEEASKLQRSKDNIEHLKHKVSSFIFYFCGIFLPAWIRIRIPSDDLDPEALLNLDPIRIRNSAHNGDSITRCCEEKNYLFFRSWYIIVVIFWKQQSG